MTSTQFNKVPHLTTSLEGPLAKLEQDLLASQADIEMWFREQWRKTPPSFYCSVDLRNAGYKISPVDTNLFPAGFNNLNEDFMPLCIQAVQTYIDRRYPDAKDVLIIPESHTRNIKYLENLAVIFTMLSRAGFNVRIGSLIEELTEAKTIALPSGDEITLQPIVRDNDTISVAGFTPQLIVLNNDFSNGVPEMLKYVSQEMMPPIELGWSSRLKSNHFQHMHNVASEFSKAFDIDPWTLSPLFSHCGEVNFMTREGENCLVRHAEKIFTSVRAKYKEYNIQHEPFVVVKADAGTYGMAVLMIKDPEELRNLNRKQRSKMSAGKGGRDVTRAIVQEGVYTFETWGEDEAVAEPVVYMIGRHVVGGFYRVHSSRGANENLNSPGMNFEPLAFVNSGTCPGKEQATNRFYSYGVIARLASIAAAREIKEAVVT